MRTIVFLSLVSLAAAAVALYFWTNRATRTKPQQSEFSAVVAYLVGWIFLFGLGLAALYGVVRFVHWAWYR